MAPLISGIQATQTLNAIPHRKHEIKISNRTNIRWVWVSLDDQEPVKVWRSTKVPFIVPMPHELTVSVYCKDPNRSKGPTQRYRVRLDDFGLSDVRHSIEVHQSDLIYRFVGMNGSQQQKLKRRIREEQ